MKEASKTLALMALGGTAVLAYQKYNKPAMKKIEDAMNQGLKKANAKLEDMM